MSLVKRSKKVMFLEGTADKFNRMKGFTSLSTSKNPKEYTRQYVDEDFETTDITGISTSIEFAFDQLEGDAVHDKLVAIIDEERIGQDAVVNMVSVDLTQPGTALEGDSFVAVKRAFTVVPGSEGDSMDAYTYSGTFRVKGERVVGEATTTDGWKTCTFTEK